MIERKRRTEIGIEKIETEAVIVRIETTIDIRRKNTNNYIPNLIYLL